MSKRKNRARRSRRRGALTIEWIALMTILGIGVITGLALVRNALVREFVQVTDYICDTEVGP